MKNWIKGTNAVVLSLAAVGIFIILTIFLHSLKGVQWDFTSNKKFSLSDKTITTLKELDKSVHVIAFSNPQEGVVNRQVVDLLEEYHKRNSKFTFEEVDPQKKPTVAEQYKIDRYGTIVFENEGKTKNVYSDELFAQGAAEGSYTFSGEEKFTQAIISLSSTEKHVVYLLTGHGEFTSAKVSLLKSSLEGDGYEVKDLNLQKDLQIPADADTLFILDPQSDLSDKETGIVKEYLNGKGKLMFSLGLAKDMESWKNWNAVLGAVGVKSQQALAVETKKSLSNDPLTIIPSYGFHDITDKLQAQNRVTILPGALALSADKDNKDFNATSLLKTSDQSYGITNLSLFTSGKPLTQDDIKKTDKDLKGPLDLAYAIESKDKKPKAIVIGNGVFLQNEVIGEQGNRDFFLNSVGWLQEQKNLVTIRPQEEAQLQQVMILPGKSNLIFYGTVLFMPVLLLFIGGAIWWRRRRG